MRKRTVTNSGDMGTLTPVVVHAYIAGYDRVRVSEYFYRDRELAIQFAKVVFRKRDCYKVQVWDRGIGEIQPNNVISAALVFELA